MRNIYKVICALMFSCLSAYSQQDSATIAKGERLLNLGYGITVKARESSAAISEVTGDEMMKSAAMNPLNALFGKGLGLTVLQNGGTIWENAPSVSIRGLNSIRNNSILVLIDGFERDLSMITKEEIESVQVLKDAAATALYGLRGSNGVLLVTTRTGSKKKIDINVNYEHHFNMLNRLPEFADGYTYALAMNEAMKNDGLSPMYDQTQLEGIKNHDPHYGNVNWMDEVLSKSGSTDNVFVTLSGGGKLVRYFSSIDYLSYKGFVKPDNIVDDYSSQYKYSKLSIRTNIDVDMTKSTLLSFKMNGMLSEHNRPYPVANDLMGMLYNTPAAAFPIKTPYGDWGGSNVWTRNPLAEVVAKGYSRSHQRMLFADMAIRQDLGMLLKGLSADVRIAYDNLGEYWDNYGMKYAYSVPNVSHPSSSEDYTLKGESTSATFDSSLGRQWSRFNLWGRVNYNNAWNHHKLDATLALSREQTILTGQHNTHNRINLLGHVHYVYADKYIADVAFSHNGSNLLPPSRRFGNFPALSAAWVASNEGFLKDVSFLDLLKVRASWGLTGTDLLPEALMWNRKYGWANGYILGGEYNGASGLGEGRLPTADLLYEKVAKANLGLDMSFLKSLDVTLELFKEKRTDMLVTSGDISAVLGATNPYQNIGKVENKGLEIAADYHKELKDFSFNVGGNFTFNRNKIIEMGEEYLPYEWMKATGRSIGQIFGYEAIGYFKDEQDIADSPKQNMSTVKPGDIKFRDLNNDDIIDEFDKKAIGYSGSVPEIYYSVSLGVEYKGLGIDALIQGTGNYSAIASTSSLFWPLTGNTSISEHYYKNRWTTETPNARYPRLSQGTNANNFNSNTVWLTNKSFLKLRHAELYYKFSKKLLATTPLKSAKLYVRASDFILFDHVDVCDPESMGTSHPIPASVQVGFSLGF
ncbi:MULTISPECIES: SusC/RagA family TonB-linked outer membrane protein [Bacteroides]|uniref:SusC/RagA family TonB-linked outer membrane protein n=1 Tax=Bacteroides TaxID=816 RepID=UPI0020CB1356|nr:MULTISPECIES: SusC/RagA family TonB-linked outer membrane protein [Bacteroides]